MGPRASSGSFYLRAGEGSGLWTGARSLSPRSRLPQLLAYPNYEDSLEESFVYLENKGRDGEGDYTFGPRTFEGSARKGRWLVLDSGDLGDDSDVDLVLGLLVGLFRSWAFPEREAKTVGAAVSTKGEATSRSHCSRPSASRLPGKLTYFWTYCMSKRVV